MGPTTPNSSNLFYVVTLMIAILYIDIFISNTKHRYRYRKNSEFSFMNGNYRKETWFKEVCWTGIIKIVRIINKFYILIVHKYNFQNIFL